MADLLTSPSKTQAAGRARHSTRVDLTPMVDLGFLLITFFIFSTRLSEPRALQLLVPAGGDSSHAAGSHTLNLVLAEQDQVFYYMGDEVGKQNCTDFSTNGLRNIILRKQENLRRRYGSADGLIILIRPEPGASYKNLVDTLDEILITGVKNYLLLDGESGAQPGGAGWRPKC